MNHLVPDLDASYRTSSHQSPPSDWQQSAGKGTTDAEERGFLKPRKQADTFVPDNLSKQLSWIERVCEDNQPHAQAISRESAFSVDVPLCNMPYQEDEMLSWLQYPLDDSFTKNYCSEQLFEQMSMTHFAKGLFPGPVLVEGEKPPLSSCQSQLWELSGSNADGRISTDVGVAVCAQRSAGLQQPDTSEVLDRAQVTVEASDSPVASLPKDTDTTGTSNKGADCDSYHGLRSQDVFKQNSSNFSFFSQHVAAMKSNLQILGTSSGPSNMDRVKQPSAIQKMQDSSSLAQSTAITHIASVTSSSLLAESDSIAPVKEMIERTRATAHHRIQGPMPSPMCEDIGGKAKMECNARGAALGMDVLEMGDVSLTSPSGSGYSTEKSAKDLVTCYPQAHAASVEDYECDSKDHAEGVHPSPNHVNSAKRRRAAEIHNQSERRRRNKINEKMKALQELIPNANKTDKASMLDEAIEYVKMLQGQLQLMSMRMGMVPPVMMPSGFQYLSMQQSPVSSLTNVGMGASPGFGMGMGRGVFDASARGVHPSTLPFMAMPPFFGQPVATHAYQIPMGSSPLVPEAQGLKTNVGQQHVFSNQQPFPTQTIDDAYKVCTEQNATRESNSNIKNQKP